MKGSHHILLETKRIHYEFDIRRNITVIRGDSATGKTTLISLLSEYVRRGSNAGVILQSDVPCVVFQSPNESWKQSLNLIENSIVFIDEEYTFIQSKDFAKTIRESSNYYVLITRRILRELPYSTKEIYGIRTSGRFHYPDKIYQEFYPIIESAQAG